MIHPLLLLCRKNAKKIFTKSSAQVATSVVPKAALQKSSGLKPKRKQANPISIRFYEDEKKLIQKKAQRAGMSVTAFVKAVMLGSDYDPHVRDVFRMLNRELTAIGRNFNQIAKHLNAGIASPAQANKQLEAIRTPLIQTLNAVKVALARGAPMP